MMNARWIGLVLVCLWSGIGWARADVEAELPIEYGADVAPLLAEELLQSSKEYFPEILESLAREQAASGVALSAEGAFDVVFSADGFDRLAGFWTGGVANTEVRRNIKAFGATVYGGYKISDGTFPIYEDINFTNTGGELRVGAVFSLLRNRTIDQRRFDLRDTKLARAQASFDVMLTKVGVQQRALRAYWRWIAAGRELAVYQDLLSIAERRELGLEEQVAKGALAEIAVIENLQNITRRRILLMEAQRNYEVAANALSFFLRDQKGEPLLPVLEQLPERDVIEPLHLSVNLPPALDVGEFVASRPELQTLQIAVERARNSVALGENDLKPQLDVSFEVSGDLGEVAEGGISRDSVDPIISFKFSVPLQRRKAHGRLQRAEAQLRAAELQRQRIEEQIEIEVRNILINLTAALQLADLADADVEQSETMVTAERRRFSLGASDFFLVNLREETAADARIRQIRAELDGYLARTSYDAATLNMGALGLEAAGFGLHP